MPGIIASGSRVAEACDHGLARGGEQRAVFGEHVDQTVAEPALHGVDPDVHQDHIDLTIATQLDRFTPVGRLADGRDVFFVFEDVPASFRDVIWFNPLFHATGEIRRGFYPTYSGDYISAAYVYGVAGALTITGLFLLYQFQDRVLDR